MRSSEPIPCSQLVEDVSLEPTWRTPAVLEQDVLSCLSLGGSWGDLLSAHSSGTGGWAGLCLLPGSLFSVKGLCSDRVTSQGTWVCLESQFPKWVLCLLDHPASPLPTQLNFLRLKLWVLLKDLKNVFTFHHFWSVFALLKYFISIYTNISVKIYQASPF